MQDGLVAWNGRYFHPDLVHACCILPTSTMDGFFLCQLTKVGAALLGLALLGGSLAIYHLLWDWEPWFSALPKWTAVFGGTAVFIRFFFITFLLFLVGWARKQPWGRGLWLQLILIIIATNNVMLAVWDWNF